MEGTVENNYGVLPFSTFREVLCVSYCVFVHMPHMLQCKAMCCNNNNNKDNNNIMLHW
jgi:hypothetical protein